jgi:hypothetical protein
MNKPKNTSPFHLRRKTTSRNVERGDEEIGEESFLVVQREGVVCIPIQPNIDGSPRSASSGRSTISVRLQRLRHRSSKDHALAGRERFLLRNVLFLKQPTFSNRAKKASKQPGSLRDGEGRTCFRQESGDVLYDDRLAFVIPRCRLTIVSIPCPR